MQDAPLPLPHPDSSTSVAAADARTQWASALDAYDVAIGCECADPSLQIESWAVESAAQQSGGFH